MSQRISYSTFRILICILASSSLFAQKKVDTRAPGDTLANKYLPSGLRVGTDVISIIKSKVARDFKGYEFNGDLNFDRYYLAVEYGNWQRNEALVNGNYTNNGNYFRIGSDINFLLKDPEKNMIFIGFRYGTSFFKESLVYSYNDSLPGISTKVPRNNITASNSGLTAHWIELTLGLRVKIWGPFWMGYTTRLKLAPSVKGDKAMTTFDIPGYGIYEKHTYWGINYQLFYRFPIRKEKKRSVALPEK